MKTASELEQVLMLKHQEYVLRAWINLNLTLSLSTENRAKPPDRCHREPQDHLWVWLSRVWVQCFILLFWVTRSPQENLKPSHACLRSHCPGNMLTAPAASLYPSAGHWGGGREGLMGRENADLVTVSGEKWWRPNHSHTLMHNSTLNISFKLYTTLQQHKSHLYQHNNNTRVSHTHTHVKHFCRIRNNIMLWQIIIMT